MKKYLFIVPIIALASCGKKGDSTHPVRKDLTEAVYASGKVFPKDDYQVYAKLAGYVEEILVHVGDSVKVGQPLLTIRSEVTALNMDAAKNTLVLAQKNADENGSYLLALKQDVTSSKSKYDLDSMNFDRTASLLKQNATSQLLYDQAKVQMESSRATWLKAKSNYSASADKLKTELANAKIAYDAQASNNSDYTISAAVSGRVYDIVPKKGELVGPTFPILEIGDYSDFEVELSVDETDIARLEKDQLIIYSIDAYKDVEFKGKVVEEYPRISSSNKTSRVIASIDMPDTVRVFSGMSVEANIIIAEKKNILVIPREYLLPDKTVNVTGKDSAVKVKVGAYDLQYVEILDGLTENDEITKE
ncbi:MAG TPA: efflux RND transporter periplasmic adaptor subunit [Bacteroidia bacterium]|jgi:RND family efflux transporter MFP subunit|nr:efflux RND transporter periplasmic adaptor subunit [Bacteroidia bacterium]